MPFANNEGVRIHYEVEGSGPALLLHHAFMADGSDWRECGYTQELSKGYQAITLDARGHGQSDKPHDRAGYQPDTMVADVLAVLDDLGVARAHYWGFSLGGDVGLRLALQAPQRLRSLVLGGTSSHHPASEGEQKATDQLRQGLAYAAQKGMAAFVALSEQMLGPLPARERAQYLAADPLALSAALEAYAGWPSVEGSLARIETPCLLYAGDKDPLFASGQEAAGKIPGAAFLPFPGLGHRDLPYRVDLVLPEVKGFLAGIGEV